MTTINTQWFLTAVHVKLKDEPEHSLSNSSRTFGFYKECNDAFRAVDQNLKDMHECLYNYLVLEKMIEGIHPEVIEECWFNWVEEKKKWIPCWKPKELEGVVNWALG